MDRTIYKARKADLKRLRTEAAAGLDTERRKPWPPAPEDRLNYAKAIQAYNSAQDNLREFIHKHGQPNLFGTATRAERRRAWLRRRGIRPVWDED